MYVHQGRLDVKPGYQWEAAGTHFDRNVTWWDQIHAWLKYLARCQYVLQQGVSVVDLCYFVGEGAPNRLPPPGELTRTYRSRSISSIGTKASSHAVSG